MRKNKRKRFKIRFAGSKTDKMEAYLTVEAAYCFSILIFLFFFLIMASLLLFVRCLTSQDDYIVGRRGSGFTDYGDAYGEIIFVKNEEKDIAYYVKDRLLSASERYPVYKNQIVSFEKGTESAYVFTGSKSRIGTNDCGKIIRVMDPLGKIRRKRY